MAVTSPNPVPTSPIAIPKGDRVSVLNRNVTHGPHPLSHVPTTGNPNGLQSAQYSQQPDMQNSSTYSQGPLRHKITNTTSQLATVLGPVAVTSPNPVSTNPIADLKSDYTSVLNQNTTRSLHPLSHDPTTLPSIHKNHTKSVLQISTPSAPPQTGTSASQIPISVPQLSRSTPLSQPLSPSTVLTPYSTSIPRTPIRQISTVVNDSPRSAKQADKQSLASHVLYGLGKRRRETETGPTASTELQPKRQASGKVADIDPSASYTVGQATPAVQKPNIPNGASTASSSLQQPLTMPSETQQRSQPLSASSGNHQQQPVNVTIPSAIKFAAAVPEVSEMSSLQDASTVPLASSTVVQVSMLPSPVHLAGPVPVPSLLGSREITQPVAPTTLEQPQPSTPAGLQFSSTGGPGFGPSAQTPQKNQPLFLPSPVSSPGIDVNDDVSISGTQSAYVASRICNLRKFSRSAKRKNYAFVLVPRRHLRKVSRSAKRKIYAFVLAPRRPPYLVKYFQLEKQKIGKRITSRSSLSKSVAGEGV